MYGSPGCHERGMLCRRCLMISAAAALASASAPEAAVRVLMAPLGLLLLRLRHAIFSTSPINVTYDEEGQLRIFAVYAAQHTNWMEPKMLCHLILARGVWGQVGILIRFGGSQVKARGGVQAGYGGALGQGPWHDASSTVEPTHPFLFAPRGAWTTIRAARPEAPREGRDAGREGRRRRSCGAAHRAENIHCNVHAAGATK